MSTASFHSAKTPFQLRAGYIIIHRSASQSFCAKYPSGISQEAARISAAHPSRFHLDQASPRELCQVKQVLLLPGAVCDSPPKGFI